jgi:hypothetical protein
LFNVGQTTLIQFPGGVGGSYTIPATVTNIADTAFYYCQNLASVTIPDNVLSIGVAAFAELQQPDQCHDWQRCHQHRGLCVLQQRPDQPHHWQQRHQHRRQCVLLLPPGQRDDPQQCHQHWHQAFMWCNNLTNLIIGNSVTNIGEEAFEGCTSLASVTFPASVTSIGDMRSIIARA